MLAVPPQLTPFEPKESKERFVYNGFDYFHLDDLLNDQQRQVRNIVRQFVDQEVLPYINEYWEASEFPHQIAMKMKSLPIWGGTIRGYGCAAQDPITMGLVSYELSRGDGSISTFYGVQSGLAMGSIGLLGSDEQKEHWLPRMAQLELIGAFGLTEPDRGSDAVRVQTTAVRDGDYYVLNGEKRWPGNTEFCDLIIIWAYDQDGSLGGFVLENPQTTEGVTIENIGGKISKRALKNANITMENVRIPAENRLAQTRSFRDTAKVLAFTRYGVAWEAAGIAAGCYEFAYKYAMERKQFGKPIAQFQLIQQKLAEMASEVTEIQLMCFRGGQLMMEGKMDEGKAAMMKYRAAKKARYVASLARETLGGNGILLEYHIARLFTDIEAVYTYEGTNEVNMLVLGRDLTGLNAFG